MKFLRTILVLLACAASLPAWAQVDVTTNAFALEITNAASTGTTLNKLAKLTGAPSTAVITGTSDTSGAIGVVVGGAGTTGNAVIATGGTASCIFDGATTAGHYVQISGTTGGDCHDGGSTFPTSGQVLGVVLSTNGGGGTYAMTVFPPGIVAAAGAGTVTSITCNAGLTGGAITTSGTCALDLAHANTFTAAQAFAEAHGTAYAPTLTSNNYTTLITDCGKTLLLPTGTTPTVTLANVNPGTAECTIKLVQMTSGTSLYTFQAASGGTLVSANGYTHTAKQYATVVVTLLVPSSSAATWSLSGEGS